MHFSSRESSNMASRSLESIASINPESLGADTPANFEFRYIDISSVNQGTIDWSTVTSQVFSTAPSRARRIVRSDDILLCTVRPALQAHAFAGWKSSENYICSTGFAVIRAGSSTEPRYLYHLMFHDIIANQLRRREIGSNYPAVNEADIRQLCIPTLDINEQRFIAHILDTLDTHIQQTEQLVAKLKQIKIGLLHDLFTRGVDENGDVRDPVVHSEKFKELSLGRLPKQWEVCPIEDKLDRIIDYRGKTPHKVNAGIPLITARNVKEGFLDLSSTEYIRESDYDKWMNRGIPSKGDILFTTEAPLGNVAQIPDYKVALSQRVLTLCANSEVLDKQFLLWLLLWENTQKLFKKKSTGSTVAGIKQSVFRKIKLQFPSLEEQKAISKVLEQHMIRLQLEEELLIKLKQIKKGLMHDLLTGRVRVTPLITESEQLAVRSKDVSGCK